MSETQPLSRALIVADYSWLTHRKLFNPKKLGFRHRSVFETLWNWNLSDC